MDPRELDNEQVESGNRKTESERDLMGQTAVVVAVAVAVEERVPQQRKIAKTISDLRSLILVPSLWNINIKRNEKKIENRDGNETLIGFEKGKMRKKRRKERG